MRKFDVDFETVMPVDCTVCGSCAVTSCSLFCTCICATSGLALLVKVTEIEAWPVEVEVDVM